MNRFSYIISASLSPNTEFDDVLNAINVLFHRRSWKNGLALKKVEQWFLQTYQVPAAFFFNSGRSALLGLLASFGVGRGDEVIIQAFTCVAVPNSVKWIGATPIYADIDASFNLDPASLEKKITRRTKAIIVQHTFGIPANLDAIANIAKRHKLILIEDCAHSLGATYNGTLLGTFGDAAFFSFGRDKSLSSVWGGAAIINANRKSQNEKLRIYHNNLPMPGAFWIFRQLIHPIAFSVILPLYNSGAGKLIIVVLLKLGLLSKPVYDEEKHGRKPHDFPAKYPNALAELLELQLSKLDRYIRVRRQNAKRFHDAFTNRNDIRTVGFSEGASYLRYPLLVDDPKKYIALGKKRGILLGNWYHHVIDPKGVDLRVAGYTKGSCPNAEYAALHCINLPTRVSSSQADKILEFFAENSAK